MSAADRSGDLAARIADYLRSVVADGAPVTLGPIEQIAVGWSHETFLFDATWNDGTGAHTQGFCLRRDPGNALLRHLSDLGEQFRVLRCLEGTAVPAPRAYAYTDDPAVLDKPVLLMEKVPGTCPSPWGSEGRRFYAEAHARGVLPLSFTDALAALHSLDWHAAGLDFLGVPSGGNRFILGEIAKWRGLIEISGHAKDPVLVDLLCYLEANAPATDRTVLVHGAYRTGNVLIDNDRVSAILDWETPCIGDPIYDVAYVLSELNREGTELLSNVVDRDVFVERYEAATGIPIDTEICRYYQLVYAMRSAAFWMSASSLYATGANADLRLARTEWSIPVVLDRAARDLGY